MNIRKMMIIAWIIVVSTSCVCMDTQKANAESNDELGGLLRSLEKKLKASSREELQLFRRDNGDRIADVVKQLQSTRSQSSTMIRDRSFDNGW